MSRRKPIDKTQIRERRDRLLASAAGARLSLTEGVREMRAIAGMTQEEFARHRGVSARVIKAIELGQGNPTMATLNRIGQFFGLEVAFVPVRRETEPADDRTMAQRVDLDLPALDIIRHAIDQRNKAVADMQRLSEVLAAVDDRLLTVSEQYQAAGRTGKLAQAQISEGQVVHSNPVTGERRIRTRKRTNPA